MRADRFALVSGAYGGVRAAARSRKKLPYVGPVGNTASRGRARHVHHQHVAYEEAIASSDVGASQFREIVRPYRAARSRRKIAYGVCPVEIRAFAVVRGPLS